MTHTVHEFTKMYECDAAETIIAYPNKVCIQMIILYFNDAGDNIKITDAASGMVGETTDDTIVDLYAAVNKDTIVIDWSAKPRSVRGLKIAAITANDCKAFIYLA